MNQITIDNILLVEVPEDAADFDFTEQDYGWIIHYKTAGKWTSSDVISPGNWQFIGTTDSMTEEMAKRIAETHCIWREVWYKNYEDISDDPYTFETALESYASWLRANKIPSDKRFAILKQVI